MKRNLLIALFFIFALLQHINAQVSCEANFSKSINNSTRTVIFTNTSSSGNAPTGSGFSYYWTFGDGTGGSGAMVTKTYASSGKYYVCLHILKNDSTCSSSKCDSIYIAPASASCNANWTISQVSGNYLVKNFAATLNDTAFKYLWTFGDNTQSDNRTPVHTYAHSGKYRVCLKVTKKDSSCTQTICDSINVKPACNPAFSKSASNTLAKTYLFEANTNDTNYIYQYTFGDGTSAVGRFQSHTYTTNGTYTVCLRVTRKDSSCTEMQCQTISIAGSNPCNANFNFNISDSIGSDPRNVRFTNTSTGTITRCIYTFGDGTMSDNCNPVHHYSTTGTKTVCLTIYNISTGHDTLCKSTLCKTFTTGSGNSHPTTCAAVFEYSRIGISSTYRFVNRSVGSPLLYKWTFDGVNGPTTANAEHDFVTPGLHLVCLKIVNALDTNCQSTYCLYVLFPGVIMGNQTCAADFSSTAVSGSSTQFEFTSLSGSSVNNSWNFGDGTEATGANVQHTFTNNGKYFVCLSVLNMVDSCSDIHCDSVQITGATSLKESKISITNIYPIPTGDELNISFHVQTEEDMDIEIFDLNGSSLIGTLPVPKGKQTMKIPTTALAPGIYILKFRAGDEFLTRKFVK